MRLDRFKSDIFSWDRKMIRHVLLIRFKPGVPSNAIDKIKAAFKAMLSSIEGVIDVEWGENNSPENKNQGFTHCVLMTFADEDGRNEYLPHPQHDALKAIFEPVLEDIIVLDYQPQK
jgi:hypothetical protein